MRLWSCQYVFCLILWGVLWAVPLWAKSSLVKQAIVAFEQQNFSEARVCIDKAMEQIATQGQVDAWYYRGVIYEKLLRNQIATEEAAQFFEETLTAYQKVLALTSVASQFHSFAQINLNGLWAYFLDRGRRYYKRAVFENAIQQFRYCQRILPSNISSYLYIAIAAHQEEKYDSALHNYTYYLESGVVVPSVVYRGLAHLTAYPQKDPTKALEILEQALLQYPFDNDLLYEQIQLYTNLGQIEAMQSIVQKQVAELSYEAAPYYRLGYWYEYHEEWQKALEYYQKAAELAPNRVEPIRQQGIIYYNQAVQATQKITEMPEEQFQKIGKKQIKKLEDSLGQALSYFEQANKVMPRDALTLKHLKTIYQRLHRPNQVKKIERRLRKYKL